MTSRQRTGGSHRGGTRHAATARGELALPVEVAPGVTVTWDPAHPHRCADVTVADDEHDPADVDTVPWLRLAAVAVLDRTLHLPLDQSLVDAEHAAARLDAARTLPDGDPLREHLERRALVGARGASRGMIAHLTRLASHRARAPAVITAMDDVVRCYLTLADRVREFDRTLAAVVDAGHRLASAPPTSDLLAATAVVPPVSRTPARGGVDRIDPRAVPARVLRFGPSWDAAEVVVEAARSAGDPAVRIRVDRAAPHGKEADIGYRLVERRSGTVRGYGLLGRPAGRRAGGGRPLEAIAPLTTPADVRVELFDAADGPPTTPHGDREVGRARRAALFQSGWRALVADVRLWGERTGPAARVRAIAGTVDDGSADDEPLWSAGPTPADLRELGATDDPTMTAWLDPDRAGEVPGFVATVSGPGDLLLAELVAAHERSAGR